MDILIDISPLKVIHWDFVRENFNDNIIVDYQLKLSPIRLEENRLKIGIGVVIRTRLHSKIGQFQSFIAQIDYIFSDFSLLKYSHVLLISRDAIRVYKEEYVERIIELGLGLNPELPIPDPDTAELREQFENFLQ